MIYDRKILTEFLDALDESSPAAAKRMGTWVRALLDREEPPPEQKKTNIVVKNRFRHALELQGIREGRIAELGAPGNSFAAEFPNFDFEYLSLSPAKGRPEVLVADISQASYIASDRYDAVFSISVLEHVTKPWRAAEQMVRILKPGGVMFHAAPFSYFYHAAPSDYWRFTPDALRLLFSDLSPVESDFIPFARRRDNRGGPNNRVDDYGGEPFAVDAFGGWRESWFAYFSGVKDEKYRKETLARAEHQVVVNLVRAAKDSGLTQPQAFEHVSTRLNDFVVNVDGELVRRVGEGLSLGPEEVQSLWMTRGPDSVSVNSERFFQWEFLNH